MKLPEKDGWYWILIKDDERSTPCWFSVSLKCFLPAGLGDASRNGLFEDDIQKIGPEIIEPKL